MNIDQFTLGELKQIATIFNSAPSAEKLGQTERPVLVTTAHRGVFFGYAKAVNGETIKLRAARNVVYWSAECRGFLGLAATGPDKSCRIGPAADIELRSITCVASVTAEAVKAFEAQPWSK